MHDTKPKGLKLRGEIWWIDKTVRVGDRKIQLRESTGCREIGEAQDTLQRRLAEVSAELAPPLSTGERTFNEAAVEYILYLEDRGKDPARAELDIRMVADWIGHLPLSHIHQRTLRPWIEAQRGERASSTVARTLRTVTAVLNYAARVLRDGDRPWLGMAVPKLIAPDWGTRQPVRLTWEEQDWLIEALPAALIAPVLFAVATGAREHEITTLTWGQHRTIEGLPEWSAWWIPAEARKANAKRAASAQDGRYLVANAMARSVIAGQDHRSEFVFPSPKGGGYDRFNNKGWRAAVKEAGLALRFHDLRHTFGERLATAGCPFDARKTILGHHHADITAHYSTPGLSRLLEEVEKVQRPNVRDFRTFKKAV